MVFNINSPNIRFLQMPHENVDVHLREPLKPGLVRNLLKC
jgi:hypothetical protein